MVVAVAAHGFPLSAWKLAATTNPVRGTSAAPMIRNMCGRSLGRRPRALIRSLGSCPNVSGCGGEIVLTCAPDAVAPLDGSSPWVLEYVYDANACQPFARRFSTTVTNPL